MDSSYTVLWEFCFLVITANSSIVFRKNTSEYFVADSYAQIHYSLRQLSKAQNAIFSTPFT